MNVESFFRHYQVQENPFAAEEARLDPVFDRTIAADPTTHPDFAKILGNIAQPSTAVVFGEKGSGKTAIRRLIADAARRHNREHPDRQVMSVTYDDLNPVLDRLMQRRGQKADKVLEKFRLADHQDTVLSLAITRLISGILGQTTGGRENLSLPTDTDRRLRGMPSQARRDLAVLAMLYDQPDSGNVVQRFDALKRKLRIGWQLPLKALNLLAILLPLTLLALLIARWWMDDLDEPRWLTPAIWALTVLTLADWGFLAYRYIRLWLLANKIHKEMPVVKRSRGQLREMLGSLPLAELSRQPFPTPHKGGPAQGDERYQLTRRFTDALPAFDYAGLLVMVDRVDEPTVVSGDPEKMRPIIWPMFDNKFLQQDRMGIKLLLPVELRHMLHRESPQFFQEARLDKQNMVDRLTWSGPTLYDLCSSRLRAVRPPEADPISLTDIFEPDVSRDMLVDALEQMHQPRDAFKFLYSTIQEHCRLVPEDAADFSINRLTLDTVRKQQSQRVQELYRGLTPA